MTVSEITTIGFAATTAIMIALYWHEVSKAAKQAENHRFNSIERNSWDSVNELREDLSRRIDEVERQIGFLGKEISNVESKLPTKPR